MDDKENNELNINPNPPEDNLVNPNPFIASSGTETKKEEETEKVEETSDEQVEETASEEVDEPAEETEKVETPVENKTEAPAFTANNLGANMASTTPFPEQGIPVAQEKKPKKFLGLIIAIVAVLVLGGGAAAAYFVMHTPEKIAASIIDNFSSKNLAVSGTVEIGGGKDSEPIKLTISSNSDGENQASASVSGKTEVSGKSFELGAGAIVLKDYTAYLKLDGLKKIMDSDYTKQITNYYGDSVSELVDDVDGTWWKISVPEIIDSIDELSKSEKAEYKEKYDCVVSVLDKIRANRETYQKTYYKENPFIKLEKYTGDKNFAGRGDAYKVSIDAEKFTGYSKALAKDEGMLEAYKCLDESVEISENDVDTETISSNLENLPEVILIVKNNFLGAELTGIYIESSAKEVEENSSEYSYSYTTGMNLKVDFNFSKTTEAVTAPEGAKSVIELVKKVTELIQEIYMKTYYSNYKDCDSKDGTDCAILYEE